MYRDLLDTMYINSKKRTWKGASILFSLDYVGYRRQQSAVRSRKLRFREPSRSHRFHLCNQSDRHKTVPAECKFLY